MLPTVRCALTRQCARVSVNVTALTQKRGVKSKHSRVATIKPPLWPYKEIGFQLYHGIYEGSLKRIDENSRIILVEGNIGSGKNIAARKIAEEFDFYYIPQFSVENILINSAGIDQRDFCDVIPASYQYPDMKKFYQQTDKVTKGQMANLCLQMLFGRLEQLENAKAHMLNTGQGVVMERSCYSDFVFVNAMRQKKLISPQFFLFYHHLRAMLMNTIKLHPHLIIYLDKPVDACMETIKKRGRPEEQNSSVLDKEYLQTIEDSYRDMLGEMKTNSLMLIYDWHTGDEMSLDRLVEDIERVDLNFFENHSMSQMENWFSKSGDLVWTRERFFCTTKDRQRAQWKRLYSRHVFEVHELINTREDQAQMAFAIDKYLLKDGIAHPYNVENKNWRQILTYMKLDMQAFWAIYPMQNYLPWYEYFHKDLAFPMFDCGPQQGYMKWFGYEDCIPDYNHRAH